MDPSVTLAHRETSQLSSCSLVPQKCMVQSHLEKLYKLHTHTHSLPKLTHTKRNHCLPTQTTPFPHSKLDTHQPNSRMNIFVSTFGELNDYTHQSDASSPSGETSSSNRSSSTADEDVILASARPKKRAGRRVFKETRHPVYRGVRLRNKNKWVCEMRVPNNKKSRIWLGTYPTPEMAARAHDVAALALRGKSACLNFADSAWRLTLPASTDAVEIRRAAMQAAVFFAAEEFRQQQSVTVDCQVCSVEVGDAVVVEVLPVVSEFDEDLHDLLLSIADEPMMSPPPSTTADEPSYWPWNDVEIFDPQVSLWDFST